MSTGSCSLRKELLDGVGEEQATRELSLSIAAENIDFSASLGNVHALRTFT